MVKEGTISAFHALDISLNETCSECSATKLALTKQDSRQVKVFQRPIYNLVRMDPHLSREAVPLQDVLLANLYLAILVHAPLLPSAGRLNAVLNGRAYGTLCAVHQFPLSSSHSWPFSAA